MEETLQDKINQLEKERRYNIDQRLLEFHRQCRTTALKVAEAMQPNYTAQSVAANLGGRSVSKMIADADKIYEWLVKEV